MLCTPCNRYDPSITHLSEFSSGSLTWSYGQTMEVCETPSRHQPRYGQSSCQSVPTRAKHSEHRGLQSNYQMLDASVIFGILLGGRKTIVEVNERHGGPQRQAIDTWHKCDTSIGPDGSKLVLPTPRNRRSCVSWVGFKSWKCTMHQGRIHRFLSFEIVKCFMGNYHFIINTLQKDGDSLLCLVFVSWCHQWPAIWCARH